MSSQSGFRPMVIVQNGHAGQASSSSKPSSSTSSQPNGEFRKNEGPRTTGRPPTFDEALHLTPLTSIVPFSHQILPFPEATSLAKPDAFPTTEIQAASKTSLAYLEGLTQESDPTNLQESLSKVRSLLSSDSLTKYSFPSPSGPRSLPRSSNQNSMPRRKNLSQFAQKVADNVKFPHRAKNGSKSGQGTSQSKKNKVNGVSHGGSASGSGVPNGKDHSTIVQQKISGSLSKPEATQTKKRKRAADDKALDYHDRKQSAREALNAFEQLVEEVLNTAELYRGDPSSAEVAKHFQQNDLVGENDMPVLIENSITSLDWHIRKTLSESIFGRIDVSQLVHLQKILEGTCSSINKLNLSIGSDPSELDIEEWGMVLQVASCAIQAVKILLRTMTAKREEKELYSEDLAESMILTLENIVDNCIVPIVESRTSVPGSLFSVYSSQKTQLLSILKATGRVVVLLGEFVSNVDFAEHAITKVEYLARKLIFVENAPTEKESVLGIPHFEGLRRAAMDTLAQIFARHPSQRISLLDEILMSLEKLPSTRQSARQFKLEERKPIQLVSALLMRLVQTSALWIDMKPSKGPKSKDGSEDEESESEENVVTRRIDPIDMDTAENYSIEDAAAELKKLHKDYSASATEIARHIIRILIQRALTSTKSGDQPYRNLLDIFTEDFLNVLGLPDWPAADLLLQIMFSFLASILQEEKRPVPQKSMALDLITLMGTQIAEVKQQTKTLAKSLETTSSPHAEDLRRLISMNDSGDLSILDLVGEDGPYRMVYQFLFNRQGDSQLDSARALHVIQWATVLLNIVDSEKEDAISPKILLQLRNTIPNPGWLSNEYDFFPVEKLIAATASNIMTMASPFCKSQGLMMTYLLNSIDSPHSQLKSKALKNVPQLLENDATLLNQPRILSVVRQQIDRCSNDSSPLVRSSALALLEKCIVLKPEMERDAYLRIVQLSEDDNAPLRKRAIKTLKDVYLRNKNKIIRANISAALIKRTQDHEEEVAKLAKQTFEELWFAPLHDTGSGKDPTLAKIALEDHVMLMIKVSSISRMRLLEILEELLHSSFSSESKFASLNLKVAKELVKIMFEKIIEGKPISGRSEGREQQQLGQLLPLFAQAHPKLFTSNQLHLLEPYVKNLSANDELFMFRAAVLMFRYVLPSLSSVESSFLQNISRALLQATPKVPPIDLPDTAMCLWIIRNALREPLPLLKFMKSLLGQLKTHGSDQYLLSLLQQRKAAEASKNQATIDQVDRAETKVQHYIKIVGPFAKICDFDEDVDFFQKAFPGWTGKSVAALTVDSLMPFVRKQLPQGIRDAALSSISMVCQSWPQNYLRNDVAAAFEQVFVNDNLDLQRTVLDGFLVFFNQEEKRSETGAEIKVGKGAIHGHERLAKSFIASDNDGAVTTIAQKFLKHVLATALKTTDDLALTATNVIVSINRQGLVHPKECGPALIALETSTNEEIAKISYKAHQILHSKHETMFEKEYMKAVTQAYTYQRNVIQDPRGITLNPNTPKLKPLFEVLKTGTSKVRTRFLANIAARVNFELPKLDSSLPIPDHVIFARFILETLAFLDYSRIVELVGLISSLEKMVVTGTGATVAHAIETEILKIKLESSAIDGISPDNPLPSMENTIDHTVQVKPERLHQLTAASMILSMVWECRTHLRTAWGLQKSKVKLSSKDLNKAPTRQSFVNSDKVVERINSIMESLESTESMMAQVRSFAELIAIDPELRIAADEDDEFGDLAQKAAGYETPSGDEGDGTTGLKSGSARKRKGVIVGGAPKRQRKSATPSKRGPSKLKKSNESSDGEEDAEGDWV